MEIFKAYIFRMPDSDGKGQAKVIQGKGFLLSLLLFFGVSRLVCGQEKRADRLMIRPFKCRYLLEKRLTLQLVRLSF